ncbi:MAG: 30S ribosome-binding factor RbfA [Solirubrobacterales bacterium]
MSNSRMRRVNEVLREVIGQAVTVELSDPRLEMVAVTHVDATPDLRSAKVFVTTLGDEESREDALRALKRAHGPLQSAINRETHMKRTPTLTFAYDDAVETGLRISAMLEEGSQAQDPEQESQDPEGTE